MSLQVITSRVGSTLIVRLAGELDHHTAELVRQEVEQELDSGSVTNVVMNMAELSFMDSSGLGVMLGRYKRVTQMGGKMVLCSVNDSLKRLFEMSGLLKILPLYQDESQALTEMGEV